MTSIHSTALRLILILPILAAQHVAAADGTNSSNQTSVTKSSRSSISNMSSDTGTSAENYIARLFEQYTDARSAGMWQEADMLAKQIVEYSIESYGFYSKHTATALSSLATVQAANKENHAAIRNFAAAIDIIERLEDLLSVDLIDPLQAMGVAQFKVGDAHQAADVWNRAVHITHVNFGPHNFQQAETLQLIAYLYSVAGMTTETRKMQRRIDYLYVRDSGQGNKEILSAL